MLGYFIEVGAGNAERMLDAPLNARFIHRQTLASAVRFTTTELADLEARIAGAADRALAIELGVFDELPPRSSPRPTPIRAVAEALAVLDVAAGLAELAEAENYCRPVVDRSLAFAYRGRPPSGRRAGAAGAAAAAPSSPTIATSARGRRGGRAHLAGHRAEHGRQVDLPAPERADRHPRPDRLLRAGEVGPYRHRRPPVQPRRRRRRSRPRPLDLHGRDGRDRRDPQPGRPARSLVILDEIGRGTATFDGLSIAWAAIEHLHEVNRSRALFATHYHELTALAARLPRLDNVTVRVKEWKGDVVFLHEIAPGAADRSYGIQVARLAGLPASVVERARDGAAPARGDRPQVAGPRADRRPAAVLGAPRGRPKPTRARPGLAAILDGNRADELTPREALEALYRLKASAPKMDRGQFAPIRSEPQDPRNDMAQQILLGRRLRCLPGRGPRRRRRPRPIQVGRLHPRLRHHRRGDRRPHRRHRHQRVRPAQYLADIALMREAGLDAYRFSLSWPRVLPRGTRRRQPGRASTTTAASSTIFSPPASLRSPPSITGISRRRCTPRAAGTIATSIGWFADYADIVFRALGDRVDTFITLNEPYIDLFMMDLIAERARDRKPDPMRATSADFGRQAPAMHHMLTAQPAPAGLPRRRAQGQDRHRPAALSDDAGRSENRDDVAAADLTDGLLNRWFLDAALRGTYPDDVVAALKRHNPAFAPAADMELLKANPVDFIGINFYSPRLRPPRRRLSAGSRLGQRRHQPGQGQGV